MKIAVIGGGLSGLACAYYLRKALAHAEISVFEQESQTGGKLQSVKRHGFLIEHSASHFLSTDENILRLVKELGCEELLLRPKDEAATRFIFDGSNLHELPHTLKGLFKTGLLGIFATLRVFCEPLVSKKRNSNDESFLQFGNRRFGRAFTDKFLDTLSAKTFASCADRLSVNAAFPKIIAAEREKGRLLGSMFDSKQAEGFLCGKPVGFEGGMQTLVDYLRNKSDCTILTNTQAVNLTLKNSGCTVHTQDSSFDFDHVVLATPSFITSRLIRAVDEKLSGLLKQIEYSPVAIVSLGFEGSIGRNDAFSVDTTKNSGCQAFGITLDSNLFAHRARDTESLARVMIGGQRSPFSALKEEAQLLSIAAGALVDTLEVKKPAIFADVAKWHKAIPNYALGHTALVAQIEEAAEKHGCFTICSSALKGVRMDDCVKNAKSCAESIAAYFGRSSRP